MNRAKQHANKSDNWVTPPEVIKFLFKDKKPDLDVCADCGNHGAPVYGPSEVLNAK